MRSLGRSGEERRPPKAKKHDSVDLHPGDGVVIRASGRSSTIVAALYAGEPENSEARYYIAGDGFSKFYWGEQIKKSSEKKKKRLERKEYGQKRTQKK